MFAMSNPKAPEEPDFMAYLVKGLAWGVVAATAILVGELLRESMLSTQPVNGALYAIVIFCAVIVMAIVAFFLGPIAALLAWPIYRRGIRAPSVYAIAGAVAAASLPLGVTLLNGSLFESNRMEWALFHIAWFAISGAFGGFMAARSLRQKGS